ncbi:hypothetical protein EYZ11_001501 [Aspergillus tanneri]|uniref:Pyruvate decarboxylase n=1 Tax=Aspergillus tanneri TaxID=1220188 RepID=A0A4S3JUH0_9EURO|nr:hypothetical protein EYZ11_001501 [Aspergillus tanneri]
MVRIKLNPVIFVICNKGYTIGRYIHGWDESYNDIQPWDVKGLPTVFGAKGKYKGYKVKTRDKLISFFANKEFFSAPYLQLVEVHMPRDDAMASLKMTAEAVASRNK